MLLWVKMCWRHSRTQQMSRIKHNGPRSSKVIFMTKYFVHTTIAAKQCARHNCRVLFSRFIVLRHSVETSSKESFITVFIWSTFSIRNRRFEEFFRPKIYSQRVTLFCVRLKTSNRFHRCCRLFLSFALFWLCKMHADAFEANEWAVCWSNGDWLVFGSDWMCEAGSHGFLREEACPFDWGKCRSLSKRPPSDGQHVN